MDTEREIKPANESAKPEEIKAPKAKKGPKHSRFADILSQLRKERGADKDATASDYMNADELAAVASMENRISVLLDIGMSYQQIKNSLLRVKRLGA